MRLYSIWIDDSLGHAYNSSYQDWIMQATYVYLAEFNEYMKFQHSLSIL